MSEELKRAVNNQQQTIKHYETAMQADRAALKQAFELLMEGNLLKGTECIKSRLTDIGMMR